MYEEGEKGADSWEGWGDQFRSVRELLEPLRDRPIPSTTEEALLEAAAPEE